MWHLSDINNRNVSRYINLFFDNILNKRNEIFSNGLLKNKCNCSKCDNIELINYLQEDKIKKLLKEKTDTLLLDKNIMKKIINHKKTINNKKLCKNCIKEMFNYKKFISSNKIISYEIAKMIGVNTCVYCNRQYIFTVCTEKEKIVRPEFDHYLPKSKYPFLALSLYNLIPSCHLCNSNCKGTKKLPEDMNPYLTKKDIDYFRFSYKPDRYGYPESIKIRNIEKTRRAKIKKLLDCFKIKEIYNYHTKLELSELYLFATKYSDTYLKNILYSVGIKLNISQEEAYRILFGSELLDEKDNDRPLSKFKRDILKELKIID